MLSRLCRRLYTVERLAKLLRTAEQRFAQLRLHNITTRVGDGSAGWPAQAPFDRIMVTAGARAVPPRLADQLALGGIMVIPVGEHGRQELLRLERQDRGFLEESLGPVRFVPLVTQDRPDPQGDRQPAMPAGPRRATLS